MRNLKKIMAIVLSMVVTASCFAGCGNKNENEAGTGKNNIEIAYWNSGLGTDWLDAVIEAFEAKYPDYNVTYKESATSNAVVAAFRNEDADTTDLYMTIKEFDTEYMESLDDVLDSTVSGESKTIREKYDDSQLLLETAADGKVYTLSYGGGAAGIVYNKKLFEEAGIKTLPRTTDELTGACDALYSSDIKPFCHFKLTGYWDYIIEAWFAQYDGYDYYLNNFYACKDESGKSPSIEVFKKEDGRYEAMKVCEKIVTNDYILTGSNSNDHITMQTTFLNGDAAMMVNGSWLSNEMESIGSVENFGVMRTPVISSITDKLTTVKKDSELRKLVTAIDSVVDGEKEITEYQNGENYKIDDMEVSAADWDYVSNARYTVASNFSGQSMFIPTYSDAKEGAKEFIKFLYSDEGYKVYADTLHIPLPITMDKGEIDTSSWNAFEKEFYNFTVTAKYPATMFVMGKHKIFTEGGAGLYGGYSFVNLFCSNNVGDKETAKQAWENVMKTVDTDYEDVWLANVSK